VTIESYTPLELNLVKAIVQAMTNPTAPYALTDAILFTGEAFVEKHALLVCEGHICDIVPNHMPPEGFELVSYAGQILAPAFIDCQVNGGGNVLLNSTPTVDGVLAIAAAHRKSGTTRLLPTCITDTPEVMAAALKATRTARKLDPSVLGIHFEGPHICPDMSGAHDLHLIRAMTNRDLELYRAEADEIFILTLSPEQATTDQIRQLVQQNIIVSIGHSSASAEQVLAALESGVTNFTHIMTRMPPIRTRDPGVAVMALNHRESYAGMIADGFHIDPELVRLVVRAKAEDRLYMVSDAAPPAGADVPLPYVMGGAHVTPTADGKCVNDNGVLAAAGYTLGQCVPIAIKDIRLDPERVLRMASTIPAEFLGLGKSLGKLLPTYKADIVAMDLSFKTQVVWRDGVKVG